MAPITLTIEVANMKGKSSSKGTDKRPGAKQASKGKKYSPKGKPNC